MGVSTAQDSYHTFRGFDIIIIVWHTCIINGPVVYTTALCSIIITQNVGVGVGGGHKTQCPIYTIDTLFSCAPLEIIHWVCILNKYNFQFHFTCCKSCLVPRIIILVY